MSLDRSTVEHVARLARIALDPGQVTTYQAELNAILELVGRLQGADVSALEPLAHPLALVARTRPDAVTESDQRETLQTIAPAVEAGYYLVPRVIE